MGKIADRNLDHHYQCQGTSYAKIKAEMLDRTQRKKVAESADSNPRVLWSEVLNYFNKINLENTGNLG